MPTLIIPIRSDNAYFAFGKQSVGGTAVAPTVFPRWEDGSELQIETKTEEIWEGDGTRHLSQIIKNQQKAKVKMVFYPRPNELGFFEQATMGAGSDAWTNTISYQAVNTSIFTSVLAGVTTLPLAANSVAYPLTGTSTIIINPGGSTEEIVTVTWPVSGSSPYNATVTATKYLHQGAVNTTSSSTITAGGTSIVVAANTNIIVGSQITVAGGTVETVTVTNVSGTTITTTAFVNGHSGTNYAVTATAEIVRSPSSHVLTDQIDGPYITSEVCLGQLNSANGETLRIRDCKVATLKQESEKGKLLKYEVELEGIATVVQGSPSTVTLENRQAFVFTQATWTLNGATTGDALGVEKFSIERNNNLDTEIQTSAITLAAIIFGKIEIKVNISLVLTSLQLFNLMYFGSTAGTTDAQAIGAGALMVVFTQPDSFHSVTYSITTIHYTQVKAPTPKNDGKHMMLEASATAVSNQGANAAIMSTTLNNAVASAY